jgi:inorganic pyrophosphatase
VIAVVHRRDDDDDKLVVVPEGVTLDDAEIKAAVAFQERFFASDVVRR